MKIKSAAFVISASSLKSCPASALPEFAFIGRSNVGKSSLINLLAQRRELAMVSATPGKTKLINFFRMNDTWTLVDLPGYGFAKVAKESRADFNEAVADFLEHRENLVRTFVLIDSKLPPQSIDLEFLRWLASVDAPFALVFTKTDQQPAKVAANIATFTQALADVGVAPPAEIFQCSATTGKGRSELMNFIDGLLRQFASGTLASGGEPGKKPAAEDADDYVDPNDWDKIS